MPFPKSVFHRNPSTDFRYFVELEFSFCIWVYWITICFSKLVRFNYEQLFEAACFITIEFSKINTSFIKCYYVCFADSFSKSNKSRFTMWWFYIYSAVHIGFFWNFFFLSVDFNIWFINIWQHVDIKLFQ